MARKKAGVGHGFLKTISLLENRISDFGTYPFTIPAVKSLIEPLDLHPKVTFFIGENGSGKSTLIEAIAVAAGFNAEGGSKNFRFSTRASESELHDCIRLVRGVSRPRDGFFLRAESYFNVGTVIDQLGVASYYGGTSVHEQSHGEAFFSLMQHRFRGHGLYILDEPEAALSPARQLAFLVRLHDLVKAGSQFVIATHSPIIMGYPSARLLQLTGNGIRETTYEETEHFTVTRDFLSRRERMLEELLKPEE